MGKSSRTPDVHAQLPTAFFCGLMLGAHPPATACRWSKALVLSSVPVLVLCVGVMMLSLDPGRGCSVLTMQLALVLTGCSGDIGLPLELRLCFEPCVQCAGQFIGRKTRFELVVSWLAIFCVLDSPLLSVHAKLWLRHQTVRPTGHKALQGSGPRQW